MYDKALALWLGPKTCMVVLGAALPRSQQLGEASVSPQHCTDTAHGQTRLPVCSGVTSSPWGASLGSAITNKTQTMAEYF